jgi:putative restriction endonuclease
MFVTNHDPAARTVVLEPGLPVAGHAARRPHLRSRHARLCHARGAHPAAPTALQARRDAGVSTPLCDLCVARALACPAAHIVPDADPQGIAVVVTGLALCAIHHLAFDRNVLGIDPDGVVHIARRLLDETDGPMLRTGLQGFHGAGITLPRQPEDRPDPARLHARFESFQRAAA